MKVLIVGNGMAGISTASWLRSLHVPFDWVGSEFGGILANVHNTIENYPPKVWAGGHTLIDELRHYCLDLSLAARPLTIVKLTSHGTGWTAESDSGESRWADLMVLATGTRPRRLTPVGIDDVEDLTRYSASEQPDEFAGQRVAVIGGADGAFEAALRLSSHCRVDVCVRNQVSARHAYQEEVTRDNAIRVHLGFDVRRVERTNEGLRLWSGDDSIDVGAMYVKIGFEANIPEMNPRPRSDDIGIIVEPMGTTSLTGLYAVGDVTNGRLRGVAKAAADGANAARAIADIYESIIPSTR